jgi:hypothetical protein
MYHETVQKGSLKSIIVTFLPLVEDGWTGVILALFVRVSELFAAALTDTLLRHCDFVELQEIENGQAGIIRGL